MSRAAIHRWLSDKNIYIYPWCSSKTASPVIFIKVLVTALFLKIGRRAFSSRTPFCLRQNRRAAVLWTCCTPLLNFALSLAYLLQSFWSFNSMGSWLPSATHLSYAQQGCGALPAYGSVPHNIWNCIKLVHPSCLRNKAFYFPCCLSSHYLSEMTLPLHTSLSTKNKH